jgi:chromosome segregation protein
MKIKCIKLYGFKSFPDTTNLALNAGITAFVGPNGSGKSNIFDALRWVFGEQSMKALRCERIEDLIYISSDMLNDANFTEVSVTIDNEDYFPQFGGEFEIKRRFYRSGESEFFLNRVKCRLADIQALFLNSGTLTYSFLELSEIEKIIHGDTKQMFDDVSGILRYQERREQTKRRLESTDQDLLRLEDIIHEMQRSVRSLRRQVRQTRLYHELRDEMRMLSLYTLKQEYINAENDYTEKQIQVTEKESKRQAVVQKIKRFQEQRETLKEQMRVLESQKQGTLDRIQGVSVVIEQIKESIAEQEREAQHIILSNERIITSIKEKEEMLDSNKRRIADLHSQYEEKEQEKDRRLKEIEKIEGELETVNQEFFSLRKKLETAQKEVQEITISRQTLKQEDAKLQFEYENKNELMRRVMDEYEQKKCEYDSILRSRQEIEEELTGLKNDQEGLAGKLDDLVQTCTTLEKSHSELESDLAKRHEAKTECKVVIDTLRNRIQEKEGIKEVREFFDKDYHGLLRENIDVVSGYEAAVDICLGDLMNYYTITGEVRDNFDILPNGRFGLIFLDSINEGPASDDPPPDTTAIAKFITLDAKTKFCTRYFKGYFVTETFDRALSLSREYPDLGFVTRDGLLIKHGTILIEKGEVGYFKISQSLTEYKEKLETIKNEILFTNEERSRLNKEIEETRNEIEVLREQAFSLNVKKSECSLRESQAARSIEKIQHELEGLDSDRSALTKDIKGIEVQRQELAAQLSEQEANLHDHESRVDALRESAHTIEENIKSHSTQLNQKRMESVAHQERLSSIQNIIQGLQQQSEAVTSEVDVLKQENAAQALQEVESKTEELRGQLKIKEEERAAIEKELPEQASKELSQKINEIFDSLDTLQREQEASQNEIMQLKYESFQASHRRDEAFNKSRDEYKIDLRDYVIEEKIVDPQTRLVEVRGKLEKLGEVNPLSLELHEKEKKRLDEFLAQRDDIIAAKKNLLGSIEELDTRARDRFVTTFSQVKEQFNFVFSNFFEGGHADLVLSDPGNPLTSKIDIIVRMKGKRVKKINQLSGGERTLLAISLLLAFYLVKPAPFCILDEIDAPLDDANVVRFNKFLRDLSQRTQVVIITHNRATMEYADYLYGLTMETPGQSKIISARLADLEQLDTSVQ